MNLNQRVSQKEGNGSESQQVDPQAALRKKCLSDLQPDDRSYLSPPERIHRTTSSAPIRYSYTELTSSSTGATDSIPSPSAATRFIIRKKRSGWLVLTSRPWRSLCMRTSTMWSSKKTRDASSPARSQRIRICIG